MAKYAASALINESILSSYIFSTFFNTFPNITCNAYSPDMRTTLTTFQQREKTRTQPPVALCYVGETRTSIAEPTLNATKPQHSLNRPHILPSFHSTGRTVHGFSKTFEILINAKLWTYHFRFLRQGQWRKTGEKRSTSTPTRPDWRPSWRTVFLYMQSLSHSQRFCIQIGRS